MPFLKVIIGQKVHAVRFHPGPSVREILDTTEFRVRSGCHGNGACGLCRVRVTSGEGGPLTASEQIHLQEGLGARGERLACQVYPTGDLEIDILNPAPPSNWRTTPEGLWRRGEDWHHDSVRELPNIRRPCGIAVDLGTTNICLSLFDLEKGRWLADRWGRNPQAVFGDDVLTRLVAAAESADNAQKMAQQVGNAIGEALQDIAVREGFNLNRIVWVTLVGNTAMLTLFAGRAFEQLLRPANWIRPVDFGPVDISHWIASWGIHPLAEIDLVAPLAGFVGSDLLAGLVATQLVEGRAPALLLDIGTNSEVALWDGERLWVTSAAGGPAFESGSVFGMPAEPGAVYRVGREGSRLAFRILGDDRPKGICGSGLVDLIARLRESNILTETGNFENSRDFRFSVGGYEMTLTKRGVDTFQRAKAGVAVAVEILCEEAGVLPQALRRVCVAGAFGRYLDVSSAQAVGLLPPVLPERVELEGNAALAGSADLLLSSVAGSRLDRIMGLPPHLISLSDYPRFEDRFIENLYLRPLKAEI